MHAMDAITLREIPAQLTPQEEAELAASMRRHPAGKRLSSKCPTCGQNASGALGDPELSTH